jgi:hypothetical protein
MDPESVFVAILATFALGVALGLVLGVGLATAWAARASREQAEWREKLDATTRTQHCASCVWTRKPKERT